MIVELHESLEHAAPDLILSLQLVGKVSICVSSADSSSHLQTEDPYSINVPRNQYKQLLD